MGGQEVLEVVHASLLTVSGCLSWILAGERENREATSFRGVQKARRPRDLFPLVEQSRATRGTAVGIRGRRPDPSSAFRARRHVPRFAFSG